jgi:hypothetical protein
MGRAYANPLADCCSESIGQAPGIAMPSRAAQRQHCSRRAIVIIQEHASVQFAESQGAFDWR